MNIRHSRVQPKGMWTSRQVLLLLLLIGLLASLFQEFAPIRNIAEVTKGSRISSTANDEIVVDSIAGSTQKRQGNEEDYMHMKEELDSETETFEKNWTQFKQKLCPHDIPAHMKYGQTLFDLARRELGLKEGNTMQIRRDPVLGHFFSFMANPGTAFLTKFLDEANGHATRAEPGREGNKINIDNEINTDINNDTSSGGKNITNNPRFESFLHIPIWKCGNNNVRINLNITIPLSSDVSIYRKEKDYWPDYIGGRQNIPKACVVAVVRDPITHFLSGYNEYETRLNDETGTNLKQKRKWIGNPVNFERFEFGSEARFEQFVVDFLNGPRKDMLFDYWSNLYHMFSMTGVLTRFNQLYKRKLTGYLPSISNLEENYPAFLNETCPGVLPESAYLPWKKEDRYVHESEADEAGFRAAANKVWESGGRTSRALCLIHAIDYACFDKIPIADLCKKVYSSGNFTTLFLQ